MAYFGVQYRGAAPAAATAALAEIAARFAAEGGPSHWDRARYVDQAGYETVVSVAYWDDVARFDAWFAPARAGVDCEGARGHRHLHRGAASHGRPARDAVLLARPARGRGRNRRRHERRGAGARLLGRHARPHSAVADRSDDAGRHAGIDPRRRAAAREGARQSLPDPLRAGLERYGSVGAQALSRRRRAGAARGHGFPARRRASHRLLRQPLHAGALGRRQRERKVLRPELVEEPRRTGALGGIASDPRQDIRRGDEIPVDARAVGKAAALSRGHGGRRRRAVLRISELPFEDRHAGGGRDRQPPRLRSGRAARDARRRCDARRHPAARPRCHNHRARRSRSCRWCGRRPRRGCGRRS